MARDEQRHELVAQLLRRHRRAVLVAGREQQRQDVVALRAVAAALLDEREELGVGLRAGAQEAPPRRAGPEVALHRREQAHGVGSDGQQGAQVLAQAIEPCPLLQAEDRAQDDLERERLQARVEGDPLAPRPTLDLGGGDLGHDRGQPRDLLAVEGRQHETPLGQVGVLVEQDHRVAADQRLEDARAAARMQDLRGRREDLLDLVGVREHHERRRGDQANGEARAEARAAAFEEGDRPRPPAHRLQPGRSPRSRRQRRGGHAGTLPLPKPWHSCYRSANESCLPSLRCPTVGGSSWHSRP